MACASCGEQVDRLRSANNARLTFRLRRLLSLRPLSSESGSVSFGHTRCRHQSYADDGLDCRAATSLFMAEVALGLTLGPTTAGGGRSAVLAGDAGSVRQWSASVPNISLYAQDSVRFV
jgi:hypothetical protein